jgi:ABC-type xylose transport system permease subunit
MAAITVAIWLIGGIIMGTLANGARLSFHARWRMLPRGGWLLLGLGALAALVGGALGTWLSGPLFGLPWALWVAGVVVVVGPWLWERIRARTGRAIDQIGGDGDRNAGADGGRPSLVGNADDGTIRLAGDGDARPDL